MPSTPILRRKSDWQDALSLYLAQTMRQPYQPGVFDCALFAAGALKAMTGTDIAATWGGYTTLEGGYRRLKRQGFKTLSALAAHYLTQIPLLQAQPGDIALMTNDAGQEAFAVVQGEALYVVDLNGLSLVGFERAERVFQCA